jgi:hypothetical protein
MNRRNLLKNIGILVGTLPIVGNSSEFLQTRPKYGFNLIGGGKINHVEKYNPNFLKPFPVYRFFCGIYEHDHTMTIQTNFETLKEDDECVKKYIHNCMLVEYSGMFLTRDQYERIPFAWIQEYDKNLKKLKKSVDVYTTIESFKTMLDVRYDSKYTSEFLNDMTNHHFTGDQSLMNRNHIE